MELSNKLGLVKSVFLNCCLILRGRFLKSREQAKGRTKFKPRQCYVASPSDVPLLSEVVLTKQLTQALNVRNFFFTAP